MRQRILRTQEFITSNKQFMRTGSVAFDPEVGGRGLELTARGEQLFLEWLKQTYGTIEKLNEAWNQNHAGLFLNEKRVFQSWDDVAQNWKNLTKREYRHSRDILRFKADHSLQRIRQFTRDLKAFDRYWPFRGGGELGLFLPSAWYAVDLEGIANAMTEHGSFYPSMHFSWHFDQVNHEIARPLFMQASLMADLFKGGWTGGWESTGGPQQLDGERGNVTPNSYYVGAGELMQLYLSQMAGGFKGFGIWTWNARSAGKEAGAWYDEWMQVFKTGKGSPFEKLFGASLDDFQYSSVNRTLKIGDAVMNGFVAAMTPTTAKPLAHYDNDQPAILENRLGKGTAVILGYEAAHSCFKPGNADSEAMLLQYALDKLASPYICDGAIVYRLASPHADHYFLLNDGPAKTVRLDTKALRYRSASDAVTGEMLTLGGEIKLAAHDARWLRLEKVAAR